MHNKALIAALSCLFASACANPPLKPSEGHIRAETPRPATIPQPVQQTAAVPAPKPALKPDTYSVVVTNVPAREILFALARDAKLNIDIHPGIQGNVTLNAIDQTLPQILSRIAKQVDMRYEVDGPNLVVMPDTPFLRTYKVDYVNMTRDSTSVVAIATQIASGAAGAGASTGAGGNASTTSVTNTAKNRFWETLEKNIKDILQETDKEVVIARRAATAESQSTHAGGSNVSAGGTGTAAAGPAGTTGSPSQTVIGAGNQSVQGSSSATGQAQSAQDFKEYRTLLAASVISNPETGVLTVRATSRQHEKIQEFLDQVMASAKRQVLIEATVVEVQLNNQYQQGINWSRIQPDQLGVGISQQPSGGIPSAVNQSLFTFTLNNNTRLGNISATIRLLESFGTVKVLSSPKISVMNNQTALLKVVDNRVYFTVKADTTTNQLTAITTFTTTPNTVSVGFVMSVTPQINESDTVLLNVRPTVSRITGFVNDPNPALVNVVNRVPEIQSREMESIIKVASGQIAVMGGLMQDSINNVDDAVPGLSRLPGIGNFFTHRNDQSTKSELVIFIRPLVVKDASIDGDYGSLRTLLPNQDFLAPRPIDGPAPGEVSGGK